jgi:predicted DNA-binding protein (MmcQ/YjbR family)
MTPAAFRKLALALQGAVESAHCGHPDFRIHNKVFASVGAPSDDWAMVSLSPELQPTFVTADAETFRPASGAWGRSGCTMVYLPAAQRDLVKGALEVAIEHTASKVKKKPAVAAKSPRSARKQPQRKLDAKLVATRRKRVESIVNSLPEAKAIPVGDGHLSLEVRGKRLGYFLASHHGDGRLALNLKAEAATSRKLAERSPSKFHIPKYVGRHGWLGIWIDGATVDWEEVRSFLIAAYRLTAPRKLAADVA